MENKKSDSDKMLDKYCAFVRPIELAYVPKHCIEFRAKYVWFLVDSWTGKEQRAFDPREEVFCYSRYGIVTIPRNLLEVAA